MFARDTDTRISRDRFQIMRPNKLIGRNTVKIRGPGLWKNLPQDMKDVTVTRFLRQKMNL